MLRVSTGIDRRRDPITFDYSLLEWGTRTFTNDAGDNTSTPEEATVYEDGSLVGTLFFTVSTQWETSYPLGLSSSGRMTISAIGGAVLFDTGTNEPCAAPSESAAVTESPSAPSTLSTPSSAPTAGNLPVTGAGSWVKAALASVLTIIGGALVSVGRLHSAPRSNIVTGAGRPPRLA